MIQLLIIQKTENMTDVNVELLQWLTNFFNKISATMCADKSATHKRTGISSENQELADELHKPLIKKLLFYYVFLIFLVNIHGFFL